MRISYDGFRVSLQKRVSAAVSIAKGKGAVSSVSKQASELGIKVLKDGGNAFDAAFAVAFSLTVFHPQAGNLGGGGYVVFKEKKTGKPRGFNYREKSPSGANREHYLNEDGSVNPDVTAFGPKSVCVPGTVKAFYTLQKNYGVLKAGDLLSHISGLANKGFKINDYQAQCLNRLAPKLAVSPESRKNYVKEDGLFQRGDRIQNLNLAKTFATLAIEGEKAFYEGSIAEQIEMDITGNGGYLTVKDLKNYSIKEVDPIFTEIKGKSVWTVPPEGGGAVLIEILDILNKEEFFRIKPFTLDFYHYLTQAFKMAAIDRYFYLGDISTKSNRTYQNIFKKKYTDILFSEIDNDRDVKTGNLLSIMHPDEINGMAADNAMPGGKDTTHFSIIDTEGNAVSNSYTLNLRYGSKWSVKGAGFLLNGSIDAFAFYTGKPNYFDVIGNKPNLFDVNKRPASGMAPVIVTDGHKLEMIIGTPGGPAIPTTLAMIIMLILGNNLSPQEAIQRGRIHHQAWPDVFYKEKNMLEDEIIEKLRRKGYEIQDKNEPIGDIQGIFSCDEEYCAVSDYRREGYALSYQQNI
ncbi:MAG: gamma-glutamyltransferase [Spirochaetes bacterium]|nr:gamma-glutamyltransferase [Spirochaetota bacterium]